MTAVVVGGGIAGLVAARALARRGEDVRLLEASDRVGGVIRTVESGGFLLELGPNTVRPTPELLAIVRELGLEGEMRLSDPRAPRYLVWRGGLHALPSSAGSFLTTPLLSPGGKLRVLSEPFVRRRRRTPEDMEESVRAFFARRVGPQIADRFVSPFVSGIFAGNPERLSADAAFPALVRGEREHGSLLAWGLRARKTRPPGPRKGVRGLLSFRAGLETLPRAIAAELGPRVSVETAVRAISSSGSGWTLDTTRGEVRADRLVLACPSAAAARLVGAFAPDAAAALAAIPSPPVAVLHFAIPRAALPGGEPLRGFGHLVVRTPGMRVLGAVWSSSLFPGRAPEGVDLVTAFAGGSMDPDAARLPEAELAALAAGELRAALGLREDPRLVRSTRWEAAIPQYELGHAARVAAIAGAEKEWKGLSLIGAYRGGISVGDVVRNANTVGPADL